MPFNCCSITAVTVFCNVSADAPGYVAVIATDGGAMLGYSATGNLVSDNAPATRIKMEMTQAKIGRSMKNRGMAKNYFNEFRPKRKCPLPRLLWIQMALA